MTEHLMMERRQISILGYEGADLVDITGPYEVFATASALAPELNLPVSYDVELICGDGATIRTDAGLCLVANRSIAAFDGADTLLVAGGVGKFAALSDNAICSFLGKWSEKVRRVGSVCTGAFILAEAGVLDGRKAVTHWRWCDRLKELYPMIRLQPDSIFVQDDNVFTSAGVTAGIDLALALVEQDCGRELAMAVAREMVVFVKRPGGQAQFSAQLSTQMANRTPIRSVQTWLATNLNMHVSVEDMAERAGMSPRNFARVFKAETGLPPRQYLEKIRVERARVLLEECKMPFQRIAEAAGFGSAEVFRRTFHRHFGIPPAQYADRFGARIAD